MDRVYIGSFFLILFCHCTSPRVKKYQAVIDPGIGSAKKVEMSKLFGNPIACQSEAILERCEYRTSYVRNEPVPDVYKKTEGVPDLSPYDQFDVLYLYFDALGVLQSWEPVVLKPR